jgi:hypothetical protein
MAGDAVSEVHRAEIAAVLVDHGACRLSRPSLLTALLELAGALPGHHGSESRYNRRHGILTSLQGALGGYVVMESWSAPPGVPGCSSSDPWEIDWGADAGSVPSETDA